MLHNIKTLLTPSEVSIQLGIAESTLSTWRSLGKGPRYVKLGRIIRYQQSDIDDFVLKNTFPKPYYSKINL